MQGSCIDLILTSGQNLHQHAQVFQSGMSDHHLMIYTMLRSSYPKVEPKVLRKWHYKSFFKKSFLKDLKLGFSNDYIFNHFINEFKEILDHQVPIKQTKLPGNTKPHVNKILRKGIMKRSRTKPKNKTNKTGSKEDLKLYKIQLM